MANQNISLEQYREYTKEETEKLKVYEEWYSEHKNKKPTPPTDEQLSFWKIAGLEASLFVLSGLGASILSAIRTGGLFFLMEILLVEKYGLNPALGFILGLSAAIASLLTFEGSLVAVGLLKGRESGKIKVSMFVVVLSLTTVILASIFSSFTLVDLSANWELILTGTLALVTGFASPTATYLLFENVGFVRNFVNQTRLDIKETFKNDLKSWDDELLASYNASRKTIASRVGEGYLPSSEKQINQSEQQQKKKSKSELAFDFVQDYYIKNNSLPTNQKVADASGVSIGSAYKAIGDFVISNKEELIFKNIVSQDDVNKLLNKRGIENTSNTYEISVQKITDFIRSNGAFPVSEEITRLDIPLDDIARFVLENQEDLLKNNLTNNKTIEDAQKHLNK